MTGLGSQHLSSVKLLCLRFSICQPKSCGLDEYHSYFSLEKLQGGGGQRILSNRDQAEPSADEASRRPGSSDFHLSLKNPPHPTLEGPGTQRQNSNSFLGKPLSWWSCSLQNDLFCLVAFLYHSSLICFGISYRTQASVEKDPGVQVGGGGT